MEWLTLFSIALTITIIIMGFTWLFAVKINNYGIVDAVWSFCFLLHGLIFFSFTNGNHVRSLITLLILGLWSLRLGYFLTRRIYGHHPIEDTRYQHLRTDYGSNYKFRFFLFFMLQAVSVSVLTLPFIFVFKNKDIQLGLVESLGVILWIISLIGESVSDSQLSHFKKISKENLNLIYFVSSCLWKADNDAETFFKTISRN